MVRTGVLAIALVALAVAPSARAAWPGGDGLIAFSTARGGDDDIWTMRADGSGAVDLTNAPGDDTAPRWSRDGRRIVFVAGRDGNGEVYTMRADGSQQRRLTDDPAADLSPTFTADGRIVWVRRIPPNIAGDLWAMRADGTHQRQLTFGVPVRQVGASIDGQLALAEPGATPAGANEANLWLTRRDATGARAVTDEPGAYDEEPDFSPDGGRLLLERFTNDDDANHVFVVRRDGFGLTQLSYQLHRADFSPRWAPHGDRIVFTGCSITDPSVTFCGVGGLPMDVFHDASERPRAAGAHVRRRLRRRRLAAAAVSVRRAGAPDAGPPDGLSPAACRRSPSASGDALITTWMCSGGAARLVQRLRQRIDDLRNRLLGDARVVQLDIDQGHGWAPLPLDVLRAAVGRRARGRARGPARGRAARARAPR